MIMIKIIVICLIIISFVILCKNGVIKQKKGHYINLNALLKHNLQIAFTKRLLNKNAVSDKESKLIRTQIDKKYISKKGENNVKG